MMQKLYRDIRSVLKPNGLLVITTPSLNAPLYRLGLLNRFDKEVGHLRRYTLSNLISLVENNGYKVIQSGRHEGVLRNFYLQVKFLDSQSDLFGDIYPIWLQHLTPIQSQCLANPIFQLSQ